MKATIDGILYDTDESKKLAHKATISSDTQLFQTIDGKFFLLILSLHVDGRKLAPDECWIDLKNLPGIRSRLKVGADITVLSARQAVEWSVKTQIPETLRGYVLESI